MLARLKFDLKDITNEILNKLPPELFESESTTFCDPFMAGGQFVKAVEERLKNCGHSDYNISKRVFGFEENNLRVRYAKRKLKLLSTPQVKTLEQIKKENMKFDVVLGNPPFQNGNMESGNFSLWPIFIEKAYELSDVVAMVCPQTWTSNPKDPSKSAKKTSTLRRNVLSKGHLAHVNLNVGKHFPNVGSTFSYFVFDKNGNPEQETSIVYSNGEEGKFVYSEVDFIPLTPVEKPICPVKFTLFNNGKELGGWRVGCKKIVENGKYLIANTSAQYKKGEYLTSNEKHPLHGVRKVIVSNSGYSAPFYDEGEFGIGHHSRALIVKNAEEGQKLVDFINSKEFEDYSKTKPSSGSSSTFAKNIDIFVGK